MAAQMRREIRSPQVFGVEGKGKEELRVGTQGGKGGAGEVQSERKQEETAKEEGQGRQRVLAPGPLPGAPMLE